MSRPRRQPCMRQGCTIWARHGFVRGRAFFCSLVCATGVIRRDRPAGAA